MTTCRANSYLLLLQIVNVCLQMLSHDPNYNYDSDEGGEENEDDMETDDFEDKCVGHGFLPICVLYFAFPPPCLLFSFSLPYPILPALCPVAALMFE